MLPHLFTPAFAGEEGGGVMSFVGMHLDVVTANPDTWSFDPFSMSRDGVSSSEVGGRYVMHHMSCITCAGTAMVRLYNP